MDHMVNLRTLTKMLYAFDKIFLIPLMSKQHS
jgi:hypothetical protein